jgi:hypothetical protein
VNQVPFYFYTMKKRVTVPFDLLSIEDDGFHVRVEILLNGRPALMLIDTGASRTVFDKERLLHFIPDAEITLADGTSTGLGTDSMEGHLVTLSSLEIGELKIPDREVALLDLVHVNKTFEKIGLMAIDGVLGSDLFVEYKAIIDYDKKELSLEA